MGAQFLNSETAVLADENIVGGGSRVIERGFVEPMHWPAADGRALIGTRTDLAARIRNVIEGARIKPVYQPVIELADQHVVGYEALSRFPDDPGRPPDRWFAAAARLGLGVPLEMAAIRVQLDALEALPPEIWLTVNVSPQTLVSSELHAVLADHDATRIVLELTEHAQIPDYEQLKWAMARLRGLGARLAVDDAGAGFATLRHVLRLEPEIIKVDRCLIQGLGDDVTKRELTAALVLLAAQTGSVVVAEGIETEDHLDEVSALRIGFGQGYLLGRPAPLSRAVLTLAA